jgi:hypothetical protein
MGGSAVLVLAALSLASCSAFLDWSDYTGGDSGGESADAGAEDSAVAPPETGAPEDAGAVAQDRGDGPTEATSDASQALRPEGGPCVLASCPKACNITVYLQACCTPAGSCGCQSTIPTLGTCMQM